MLFRERFWSVLSPARAGVEGPGIADGSITLAFRRWKRPTVRAGGTLQSPVGLLSIEAVEAVGEHDISDSDARRAGFASRSELVGELDKRTGELYRIKFRLAGPDPRIALREQASLAPDEVAELRKRLARLDAASRDGPWTAGFLRLIAEHPGTRAADLAPKIGEGDLARFKTHVRRLKNLGLAESLGVGYRISPRGQALLQHLP